MLFFLNIIFLILIKVLLKLFGFLIFIFSNFLLELFLNFSKFIFKKLVFMEAVLEVFEFKVKLFIRLVDLLSFRGFFI